MWWSAAKYTAKIYAVLWLTAIGGFLGANALGVLASLLGTFLHVELQLLWWIHAGWYAGTALAFIGAVTGNLRFHSGPTPVFVPQRKRREPIAQEASNTVPATAEASDLDATRKSPRRTNVWKSALMFGLVGGFLGAFLGGSLLMFWFSLAYSPYAPTGWASTVEVKRERISPTQPGRQAHTTSHPVALYLCVTPAVVGGVAGIILGGVGAALGKTETT